MLNVKITYLHIWQLSFAGLAGFVLFLAVFSPFFHDYILLSAAKISTCIFLSFLFTYFFVPIRWYLKPLKGRNQNRNLARLQTRFSQSHFSCQLALEAPPPKQPQTRTSEPFCRLVYRLSRDSRYYVSKCELLVFIRQLRPVLVSWSFRRELETS